MDDNVILNTQYKMVRLCCKNVPVMDLAIANNVINFPEADPTAYSWYEKLSPLFTENGGKGMHDITAQAFGIYVVERIEAEATEAQPLYDASYGRPEGTL